MRRSEAIKIINSYIDNEETSEEILSDLEKVGMLPPVRNADQKSSYGYARVWIWEKEIE